MIVLRGQALDLAENEGLVSMCKVIRENYYVLSNE